MDIKYPVTCPLMDMEISAGECFDMHMVVDGWAPEYTAPEKARKKEGYKDICKKCPFHRDD